MEKHQQAGVKPTTHSRRGGHNDVGSSIAGNVCRWTLTHQSRAGARHVRVIKEGSEHDAGQ